MAERSLRKGSPGGALVVALLVAAAIIGMRARGKVPKLPPERPARPLAREGLTHEALTRETQASISRTLEGAPKTPNARPNALAWLRDHDTPLLEARLFERHFAALEQTRLSAPDDPAWSRATEEGIRKLFQAELAANATLEVAACRAFLCRVEAGLAEPQHGNRVIREVQSAMRLDQATARFIRDERRVKAYFAKEGESLPDWDFDRYLAPELAAGSAQGTP